MAACRRCEFVPFNAVGSATLPLIMHPPPLPPPPVDDGGAVAGDEGKWALCEAAAAAAGWSHTRLVFLAAHDA